MIDSALDELKSLSEDSYKAFNSKIIPTKQKMLGVRVPTLRKMAKQIVKEDALGFVQLDKKDSYEMILLEGIVLSYMKKPFLEIVPHVEVFLLKVDNWAQIDSVICNFRVDAKNETDVLHVVNRWLKSDEEFVVRAGLIMLLDHYMKEENLEMIFEISQSVKHDGYYVFMANAWLISVCMAKFPIQTIEFFKSNNLDKRTQNKAIQKSRESYRVSKEHKALILGYNK